MTAQETNLLNAFETTLTGTIGASDLTITVNSVVDSASNTLTAPCYLVLNPDSATSREVVQVTSINVGTKTLTLDNINKRYLTGSAATSGLSHASGSVVRMSPLQQHIEDINDRVDTVINEAGTALNTTLFLDEDDMTSNSATKGVTQQSVKAYVDTQLTAEDLDISADSGSNIAIDLDSEVLDLEGGTGIDTTTGTNKVTFAIDSTVATLTGSQALTNKTIDVDSNTVSNIEVDNLKSGVLDTDLSSTAGTDTTLASAKAIKTYVDTQITAEDLDVTADSGGPISIDLDSETLDIAGGTGITTTASGNEISVAIDSTVVTESSTDTLTNKTIDADGTGNSITNIEDANIKSAAAIDASKIADGSVSNAEFQRLDGVTSDIQTQLDGKQASGSYITASSSDTLTNKTFDVEGTGNSISNIDVADFKAAAVVTESEGIGSNDNDTTLPTSAAVKDYVDSNAGDVTASSTTTFTNKTIDADATGNSITNIEDANIKASAAIDAAKIADGSVSNAEFQRLDGVTSDIQTQLDAKGDVTASSSTTFTNKTFDVEATGNSISNVDVADFKAAAIVIESEGIGNNDNDTTLPTSAAVIDYVANNAGSSNALVADNSDFTLTDTGTATGIHYELDNVDTADWNQGGIALTSVGGIFRHSQTQDSTYTVASTEGAVVAGPISIGTSATVTIAGTMVIL
jgi:hypothetical protein